jgi:hypothetical protein
MKRLLLVFLALLIPVVAWGRMNTITVSGSGGGEEPGGGPDTWYYGIEDPDDYDENYTYSSAWAGGDDITVTTGGSITDIAVKMYHNNFAGDVKCVLYYDVTGTWTEHETVEVASANVLTDGSWTNFELTTPYTVADSEDVAVMCIGSQNVGFYLVNPSTSGYILMSQTYADWGPTTISPGNDWTVAVRVYVD